ncbi:MAG: YwaF family protein [Acholeplasmatales bacterium]|jgi:hypothetical protein|nr:YwaF family protein [Acholeplasmatales bacterium]
MGTIFDSLHISYLVISLVLTAGILVLAKLFLKSQKAKNIFLLVTGILPFVLHISIMWYDFLATGEAPRVSTNILFTVYPCNLVMFLVMIIAFLPKKNTKIFQSLCIFAFYVGIVGNIAALIYPIYYLGHPLNYEAIKSVLSHSILFICCLWLYIGGYFKIKLTNIIPYSICLAGAILIGVINFFIFKAVGADYQGIMYIQRPAIPNTPLTIWIIAPLSLVVFGLVGFFVEFKDPKKERSYLHFYVFDQRNVDGSTIKNSEVKNIEVNKHD